MFLVIFFLIASALAQTNNIVSHGGARVINGQNATLGQFPWQVGILNFHSNSFCGGAIISEEWVLTSASCIYRATYLTVYSGVVDLDVFDMSTVTFHYTVHEEFDYSTLENDIAVVHLDPPLVFSDNTTAIELSPEEVQGGIEALISGWGQTNDEEDGTISEILQYASVTTLDNSDCAEIYGEAVSPAIICAVGENPVKNPCVGDGGGALVVNSDNHPLHVGIFSFTSSSGCELNYPAGYVRTSHYIQWIKEKTGV